MCAAIFIRGTASAGSGGAPPCGDGVIDLFDILEMVDIILGLVEPTPCQVDNGDVPNGMPPYCGSPAGTAELSERW